MWCECGVLCGLCPDESREIRKGRLYRGSEHGCCREALNVASRWCLDMYSAAAISV
jgi:hypothetical protein